MLFNRSPGTDDPLPQTHDRAALTLPWADMTRFLNTVPPVVARRPPSPHFSQRERFRRVGERSGGEGVWRMHGPAFCVELDVTYVKLGKLVGSVFSCCA